MEQKDIFLHFADVTRQAVVNINNWSKAILKIKWIKGNAGFENFYVEDSSDIEKPIDTAVTYETFKNTQILYDLTQNSFPIHKNWNRIIFFLFPDNKIEIEYIWDQDLQDEVESYNKSL